MSILKAKYKKPIITFGLGKSQIDVSCESDVKIYVTNIFNSKIYEIDLQSTKGTVTKINNNEFSLKAEGTGDFSIVAILKKDGIEITKSQQKITTALFTADNGIITADTNLYTADNG